MNETPYLPKIEWRRTNDQLELTFTTDPVDVLLPGCGETEQFDRIELILYPHNTWRIYLRNNSTRFPCADGGLPFESLDVLATHFYNGVRSYGALGKDSPS